MTTIAFIGVGNMGGPMARNLLKAQHGVRAFDLSANALKPVTDAGATAAKTANEAIAGADVVITMLPAGQHVRNVYLEDGVLAHAKKGALLIDCSTIDIDSARAVHAAAEKAGFDFLDAPVSGGVGGAEAGTLAFMCGGSETAFGRAQPILEKMGKRIVHAGGAGAGQAAKICNNMLLAISMIGTCEAFVLGEKLGLDPQKLFDIMSAASGQCWSLTTYCPVPGPVPTAPSNRDYTGGFATALMLKDLKLAQGAAQGAGAATPLGAEAAQLYALFAANGHATTDFSGIINMLRGAG
jgi:3-hydroxyisobutyrate dehydrogenase